MKRTIEVKERQLIDRLNSKIEETQEKDLRDKLIEANNPTNPYKAAVDVAEEEKEHQQVNVIDTKVLPLNDSWKEKYFEGKEIKPMEVSLTPRDDAGNPVLGVEEWDNPLEDNRESRAATKPTTTEQVYRAAQKLDLVHKMNEHLKEKAKLANSQEIGTHLRTHDEDLPFPGKVETYEMVNHPKHYNHYDVEVIDMMERIFGLYDTYAFCKLNAYKYRMRAGTKPGTPVQQDLDKEQWYLTRAENIKSRMTDSDRKRAEDLCKDE